MNILEVSNIRKEYGTLVAVNDLSFSVEKGQVVGLIGPNGAGKTTLLRILATVLTPTDGTVRLLGYDLQKDYLKIRENIGYLPDFFNLYHDLTLQECLEFFAQAYKVPRQRMAVQVDNALQYVELESKRRDFIRHLSRGMVQRLGVAALLVHNPDLLLLDEPASGLDPAARIKLRDVLRKLSSEGKTIIISSHILTELSGFCSHIAIMNEGKLIVFDDVEQIQRRMTPSRKLTISVLNDCEKAVALVTAFPQAQVLAVQNNIITADLAAGPEELAQLNAHLVQNNIRVAGFHEESRSLEDVFMKISAAEN